MGNLFSIETIQQTISSYWDVEEQVESEDLSADTRLMALQGSSTYLAKYLGLSNKVVSRADWITALENKRAEWMNDYDLDRDGPLTPIKERERRIDLTNLVNLVFAQAVLKSKHLDTDWVISQREFTDENGKPIFSSFWSGYIRERLLPILRDSTNNVFETDPGFIFIDVGTGELKFFGGQANEDFRDFTSEGQFGSMDGTEFNRKVQLELDSESPSALNIANDIRSYIRDCEGGLVDSEEIAIYCAASESMRQLQIRI